MGVATGSEFLPQFEDRLLYYVVDHTPDYPLSHGQGVSYGELVGHFGDELAAVPAPEDGQASQGLNPELAIHATVSALEREGFLERDQWMGGGRVRPTRHGRQRVAGWRKQWNEARDKQDRGVQERILRELDEQRRENPEHHKLSGFVDVEKLCVELNVPPETYLSNARRLLEQGKIALHPADQDRLEDGKARITEAGVQALEAISAASRPQRDAQVAWVEVARYKRELELAQRQLAVMRQGLPALIGDDELRRRCEDLLTADGDHDRAVSQAGILLEDRVRRRINAPDTLLGTELMTEAFRRQTGKLTVSDVDAEQEAVHQLFRGVVGAFKNPSSHRIIVAYTQGQAVAVVRFVDLLLGILASSRDRPTRLPSAPSED